MSTNPGQLEFYPPPDKSKRPAALLAPTLPTREKEAGRPPDPFIADLAAKISQARIKQWVEDLCAFPSRHTESAAIAQVADWLVDQFALLGYSDVMKHAYVRNGHALENIVCTKPGAGATGRLIILCGHYDCKPGPGADDNASGVAAILEVARVLKDVTLADTVQFVAFSGEEQGMWGSTAYAQYVQDNNIGLHRLINLDMVAYPPADFSIVVERDEGNAIASNDAASSVFADLMAQMAADYTSLTAQFGNIYGSDYMPFEARGYVVIGAYEAGHNPAYHTADDMPATLDYAYATEVARMTLATLVSEARFRFIIWKPPYYYIRRFIWIWVIIVGGLMVTPGGVECVVCGPAISKLLGLASLILGAAGLAFDHAASPPRLR